MLKRETKKLTYQEPRKTYGPFLITELITISTVHWELN